MTLTFNELRRIKDSLPDGSVSRIAQALNLTEETVRNYFGGEHYARGESAGFHIEPGPDGGVVLLEDTRVLDMAREIIASVHAN